MDLCTPFLTLVGDRSLLLRSEYPQIIQAVETIGQELGLSEVRLFDKWGGAVMSACWVLEHSPAPRQNTRACW